MEINGYKIEPGANLRGANLQGANLQGANLGYTNLGYTNLEGANLRDADLRGTDMRGANLQGANLQGADLCGANLHGARLRGADLRGATSPCGFVAPLIVVRLAELGACAESIVWAWNMDPDCTPEQWWPVIRSDWREWLGGSLESAMKRIYGGE